MENLNSPEYKLHLNDHLEITELNEDVSEPSTGKEQEYFISEPFDYIFEPDHYPKKETSQVKESSKFKQTRLKREINGVLEYEYRNFVYNNSNLIDLINKNLEDLDVFFLDNIDYETHLHGLIRGISLVKWPQIGFGFSLAKQKINDKSLVYVNEIFIDSPAESCLQLGDIILEIDELNISENNSIESLNKYLDEKDSIHLMVIHKSKYAKLKKTFGEEDFFKNLFTNCEDIVICNYMHGIQQERV